MTKQFFQHQESSRQSRAFGGSELRTRTGRRNDKFLSIWQNVFPEPARPDKKSEAKKSGLRRAEQRKAAAAAAARPFTDSPITFIKMPATPYTFQRGVGFVSPPAQFPIFSFLGGLGSGVSRNANEQQRSVAEPKMDAFDEADRSSSDSYSSPGLVQNLLSAAESKPSLLIGSPMCTAFSTWQRLNERKPRAPERGAKHTKTLACTWNSWRNCTTTS